ncbi:hypothetical protein [Tepidibacillus fermentans]|uniref:Spy/CpxP family protein refolding chaperone n=1 Tax=Tepidibacillus fermentans TaxID=1281767 RepID=A0A4R3KGL0_9BACI|nr:hypothetical protein [Tepidibacillus fermentans]TCS82477.1 hypothetical protein EDD72_10946 [Tepidibacillus fermentans]
MKLKHFMFAGAIAGAMGIGAMIGPAISSANTTDLVPPKPPVQIQQQNTTNSGWGGMGLRMGQYFAGVMHDEIAKYLGISDEELYNQRLAGKSLEQIAKEKGKSSDEIAKMLIENKKAQLDQLVKDKKITEEQKQFILERMETNTQAAIKNQGIGRGRMGGSYGQGYGKGFGGGPRWSSNNNN